MILVVLNGEDDMKALRTLAQSAWVSAALRQAAGHPGYGEEMTQALRASLTVQSGRVEPRLAPLSKQQVYRSLGTVTLEKSILLLVITPTIALGVRNIAIMKK